MITLLASAKRVFSFVIFIRKLTTPHNSILTRLSKIKVLVNMYHFLSNIPIE